MPGFAATLKASLRSLIVGLIGVAGTAAFASEPAGPEIRIGDVDLFFRVYEAAGGRPLPSHRAWSLVEKPPRERPSASACPAYSAALVELFTLRGRSLSTGWQRQPVFGSSAAENDRSRGP